MNNKPICVFDSGLGGLTAVRELRRIMPNENIIYFGDTGRMPYGGRSKAQIRTIARQNIAFAESFGVKAILAACGTISSNAQDILAESKLRIIGVLTPGTKELAATGKKRLGVIATATSIKSGAFQAELKKLRPDAEIIAVPCPEFVPMIESGHISADDATVKDVVKRTLEPDKEAEVEALLLGCTHYGIIVDAISRYLPETKLVGAADASARALKAYLDECDAQSDGPASEQYFTSGSTENFISLAPVLLGELKGPVRFVEPAPLEVEP